VGLARLLGISRTQAAALAEEGRVEVDGARVGKSDPLPAGGLLSAKLRVAAPPGPPPEEDVADDVLPIVYRDADLVIVDKPVGIAAHVGPGWSGPTVLGILARRGVSLASEGPAERQGIVQRLDVGTSGLMAVACSNVAYRGLKRAFKQREVSKTYHAAVHGLLDPMRGSIDAAIGRHPGGRFRFAVTEGGKRAVTHYEVLEVFPGACLASVDLETGRTHQIRVHLAAVGHPLLGDPLYGGNPREAERLGLERQWLHAVQLGFTHPVTGEQVRAESPYPADLTQALERLRGVEQ